MSDEDEERTRIAAITRWVEENVGGTVRSVERHARWRPSWTVLVDGPQGALELYVRADRGPGLGIRPLRDEYAALTLLERQGVPVPHVYGWCSEPEAIVMASLADAPFHGGADTDPTLHAMVGQYMTLLASVHKIDLAAAAAAGFVAPADSRALALAWFNIADAAYRANKTGPDPLVEFVRGWVLRHIPLHRERGVLLIGDAPQFFHDGGRVTALYDLELAHIGDPMMDLASIRVRDINEPIGGLTSLIDGYAAASGEEIDWATLDFHTVVGFIASPMMVGFTLRGAHPHPAFIEYLSWQLGTTRAALEVLAESLGLSLDPVDVLHATATLHSHALADLVAVAQALPAPDGMLRQAPVLSLALYAQRVDEIGAELERIELHEAEALLARPCATLEAAEELLEAFVLADGAEREADLIRFFHRRTLRRLQLLSGYPAPIVTRGLGAIDRTKAPPQH